MEHNMQENQPKETLKNEQLEFILRQNYCLTHLRKVNGFDPIFGGWHNLRTKDTSDYQDFVKRRYNNLLALIYEKQPELQVLEKKLFSNISSFKFFEKHFISTFQSQIYPDTLSSLFFKVPYDSLPKAELKNRIESFINNSEFMKTYIHEYLLTAKSDKDNFPFFESYILNLSKVNIPNQSEFFKITSKFSEFIKSETFNKKLLKEVSNKFIPSPELKENLLAFFKPFLSHQHDLRDKLNDYMVKTYNHNLKTENTKFTTVKKEYQTTINVLTSSFVDQYNLSTSDANSLSLKLILAIQKTIQKNKHYSKSSNNSFLISNDTKERYGKIIMDNLDDFLEVSKFVEKIEATIPDIVQHVSTKEISSIQSDDLFKFIQDSLSFNHLKEKFSDQKEKPTKPTLSSSSLKI